MSNIRYEKYQLRVNNPDGISSIDVLDSIQSQYAASPHMLALLVSKAALADPGKDVMIWYDKIFNPRTAEGIGLDIWGRIVGVARKIITSNTAGFFGFAGQNLQNFNRAPFWNPNGSGGAVDLNDEAYRFLIFYKAAANIGEGTLPTINRMLRDLFQEIHEGGNCYVLESGTMAIRAVFDFYLTNYEQSILREYGIPNRPAGVLLEWYQYKPSTMFGFAGQNLQNFDHGSFTPYQYQQFGT